MNLSVSTHWPSHMPPHLAGKPTQFRENILNSLLANYPIAKRTIQRLPKQFKFKPHTIRADKNKRWKPGMRIHFFEWTGKPYRSLQFKFAPTVTCVATQHIEIIWTDTDGIRLAEPTIFIDNKWIVGYQKEQLAINDGFDSLQSFYAWFNTNFTGTIIHWTNLKY